MDIIFYEKKSSHYWQAHKFVFSLSLSFSLLGTYQSSEGQGACDLCPEGSYCDPYELNNVTGVIVPQDCIMGHYCPNGTEYAEQNKCPPGTYSNQTNLASVGKFWKFSSLNFIIFVCKILYIFYVWRDCYHIHILKMKWNIIKKMTSIERLDHFNRDDRFLSPKSSNHFHPLILTLSVRRVYRLWCRLVLRRGWSAGAQGRVPGRFLLHPRVQRTRPWGRGLRRYLPHRDVLRPGIRHR